LNTIANLLSLTSVPKEYGM